MEKDVLARPVVTGQWAMFLNIKEGRFRLDSRKTLFMMRVVRHWNMLSRETVNVPSLETFKVRLDGVLRNQT